MKTLNETFTDKEYEGMLKVKGKTSWHDFILILVKKEAKKNVVQKKGKMVNMG